MGWSSDDLYLFNQGTLLRAYENMGAHPSAEGGISFSVWVPGARSVTVAGSFNDWRQDEFYLSPLGSSGVWTATVPAAREGDLYKFFITTDEGEVLVKADPYAFLAQLRPETASVISFLEGFDWNDGEWLVKRASSDTLKSPMNIYEVHLGSWRGPDTHVPGEAEHPCSFSAHSADGCEENADGQKFMDYRDIANQLVPYVRSMGYTHIELLPVAEHPFDGSWGYQVTGYFAPTSRYGSPKGLMYLVNKCHEAGIGVIMDWVPGHFCRDAHGLGRFNGHKLYEKKDHKEWGTYIFDLGRPEVKSFLLSNAHYWLAMYHFDGIRVDGVSSMLYLNYGVNNPSEKVFNENGGEENLEAVKFLQDFNSMVGKEFKGVFTVAEESTAWPLVTYPPSDGGLGFNYKWNMGWMNDTLRYFSVNFPWRGDHHNLLTFSMMYAFSENFILPFSHDEVVHGKCSLIGRMPGYYNDQFAGLRLLAMYQICHPGSKLSFMGNEFGQFIEWRFYEPLEWFLLDFESHRKHLDFIRMLNLLYLKTPALWRENFSWEGFRWIDADNRSQSVLSFYRTDTVTGDICVCVFNMSTIDFPDYGIGVPEYGIYREMLTTDMERFGGSGAVNDTPIKTTSDVNHGLDQTLKFHLPPLSGIIFALTEKMKNPAKKEPAKKKAAKKTTVKKKEQK